MTENLKIHIQKFVPLSEEEFADIASYFTPQVCKKKETLLKEGQICKTHYFVAKGILRKFFINEKGVEHTTEFAIEDWWMTDTISFLHESPAAFYIQAVEAADILVIQKEAMDDLLEKHPVMEKYFRQI